MDRQRRRRGVAVTIGQRVIEDVVDVAGRAGIPDIAIVAVCIDRQDAILALDDKTALARLCRPKAGDGSEIGIVGAERVAAVVAVAGIAGGRVGDDVASGGTEGARRDRVRVRTRRRRIVDNADDERRCRGIPVIIGHGDREIVVRDVARRIVEQRIAIADRPVGNAGDR